MSIAFLCGGQKTTLSRNKSFSNSLLSMYYHTTFTQYTLFASMQVHKAFQTRKFRVYRSKSSDASPLVVQETFTIHKSSRAEHTNVSARQRFIVELVVSPIASHICTRRMKSSKITVPFVRTHLVLSLRTMSRKSI